MPIMGGLELAEWIENNMEQEKQPMIIAISGYAEFEYARGMMQHHALNYLLKPVDREELAKVLWNAEKIFKEKGNANEDDFDNENASLTLTSRHKMETALEYIRKNYGKTIDMAEDRDLFNEMMEKLEIPMPESGMAVNVEEALEIAKRIGYPLMVRPSYVLGGRGMEVVYDDDSLKQYMAAAVGVTPDRPILIDRFLNNAMECEADAISDGTNVFVPAVMEHIELAGIHSGDSACILPSKHIPMRHLETIKEYTKKIAKEMNVRGLMNMQYAIADDKVYVLEANPRASRTVPLVSKVCNVNMVKIATDIVTMELTGRESPVPN